MDASSAKAVTSKTRKLGPIVWNFETWNLEAIIHTWRTSAVGSSNMARQLCHLIISSRETTNEGSKQPPQKKYIYTELGCYRIPGKPIRVRGLANK
jgi:hypothetical protein